MSAGYARIRWRHGVGFALIELLVVAAIIVILAALLFPTGKNMFDESRTTKCLNNLKQLGVACHAYSADNDGRLPTDIGSNWRGNICPYLGIKPTSSGEELYGASFNDVRIFTCPFIFRDGPPRRSYGINYRIEQGGKVDGYRNAMTLWVQAPSRTALLADALNKSGLSAFDQLSFRHPNGHCGVFYVDGHVENMSSNQIPNLTVQTFFGGQN